MTSKELYEQVTGLKFERYVIQNGLPIGYISKDTLYSESSKEHNVYELAYKCKQWAYSVGYDLVCTNTSNDSNYCVYCYILDKDWRFGVDDFNDRIAYKSGLTEVEAIFKACQWILDNKETK